MLNTWPAVFPFSFSKTSSATRRLSLYDSSGQLLPRSVDRARRTNYFGSRCTYPLLRPFTSLTTSSKLLKSSAVTASKATSRRTSDHSKKA